MILPIIFQCTPIESLLILRGGEKYDLDRILLQKTKRRTQLKVPNENVVKGVRLQSLIMRIIKSLLIEPLKRKA
jgi:hypothetical protein